MVINLKEFMEWYKTTEVVLWDKKRVFREPTIEDLLKIEKQEDVWKLIEWLIMEWTLEELDKELYKLTKSQKEAFMTQLLSDLGLVWKEATTEIENTTNK